MRLFPAEIDQSADFAAEIFSMDDHINETMLQEKFRPLKAFGKFNSDRLVNRTRAGKSDQGIGLGNDNITQHGKARRDSACRRIG